MFLAKGGSVDDEMLNYGTMFYDDGGYVPGFAGGGMSGISSLMGDVGGDAGSMGDIMGGMGDAVPYLGVGTNAVSLGTDIAKGGPDQATNIGGDIGGMVGSVIPIPFMGAALKQVGRGIGSLIGGHDIGSSIKEMIGPAGSMFNLADGGQVPRGALRYCNGGRY
jgi:hypothetical protein